MSNIKELLGKILTKVKQVGNDEIIFVTNEGKQYKMYHNTNCCESVTVEDVIGDLNDLIGEPICMAEEVTSHDNLCGITKEYQDNNFTWTFYKLATVKGYVTIRWYGSSNGYYSEEVDFEEVAHL